MDSKCLLDGPLIPCLIRAKVQEGASQFSQFEGGIFRVFYVRIMLSANSEFYFFFSNMNFFYFFFFSDAVAKTSKIILNTGESGQPSLVTDFFFSVFRH